MPGLHIVSDPEALSECLQLAAAEDTILLIGRAASLADRPAGRPMTVLAEDVPAGSDPETGVVLTDYPGFVDLVAGHQPIITWH